MLNSIPLKDRARGRWSGILPALGIAETFLTGKHGPCPLCGGKDRWRWDNLEGRGTWICSKCGAGDGIALVMERNGWEFSEAARQIEAVIGSVTADLPKRERSDRDKRDAMNKLWRVSKTVETGDPVGRYLFRRVGLTCFQSCLRTAYDLRYQSDYPSFHPAMIAIVTGPDGAPSTLHRTYLTNDGRKADARHYCQRCRYTPWACWRCVGDRGGHRNGAFCNSALRSALLGRGERRDAGCVAAATRGKADHRLWR
jgi:putative DNA primase/helicase